MYCSENYNECSCGSLAAHNANNIRYRTYLNAVQAKNHYAHIEQK